MIPARVLLAVGLAVLITLGGRTGMPWVPLVDRGPSAEQYGERILALPDSLGDWQLVQDDKLSDDAIRELKCDDSYVARRYVHARHGGAVDLILLAGPPGPLTAHTPEICYSANNYRMISNVPFSVGRLDTAESEDGDGSGNGDADGDVPFRSVHLKSARSEDRDLLVVYAWNDGESWRVPTIPRMAFTSRAAVVKIQLAVPRSGTGGVAGGEDLIRDFLSPLLAELNQTVFVEPRDVDR